MKNIRRFYNNSSVRRLALAASLALTTATLPAAAAEETTAPAATAQAENTGGVTLKSGLKDAALAFAALAVGGLIEGALGAYAGKSVGKQILAIRREREEEEKKAKAASPFSNL